MVTSGRMMMLSLFAPVEIEGGGILQSSYVFLPFFLSGTTTLCFASIIDVILCLHLVLVSRLSVELTIQSNE